MADVDFLVPPFFPTPRIDSFEVEFEDPWIEFEASAYQVRRRILSEVFEIFVFTVYCSEWQRQNMRTFVRETINGGVKAFNWMDPRSDEVYEVKFLQLPRFSHLSALGDDSMSETLRGKEWSCQINLRQISGNVLSS